MPDSSTLLFTFLAMAAFAGNSLLCRAALRHTGLDPASFTALRLLSGAAATWAFIALRGAPRRHAGSWGSALALFAYAAGFSFAYLTLPAGTGALLLFLAVQATMLLWGLRKGERLAWRQGAGLALALAGLILLLRPGLSAPPLRGALLMLGAGVAWGIYCVRGMGSPDPGGATAGNFRRAVPLALLLSLAGLGRMRLDPAGCLLAVLSGALASGLGYVLWYRAMKGLRAATAASVQLSVPVLAALAGVAFLGEPLTLRMGAASVAILGGIALVVTAKGHEDVPGRRRGASLPFMRRFARLMVLVAVLLTVFGGMHYYLYVRLLAGLGPCGPGTVWALRVLLTGAAFAFPLLRILFRTRVWRAAAPIQWLVAIWLGLALYAFLTALALQAGVAILRSAGSGWPGPTLFGLAPGLAGIVLVGAATATVAGIGFAIAQALPRITRIEVPLPHLPADLDGFTVVQLSDVHVGAFARHARLRGLVARVNALAPDLVVITGDLVDEKLEHLVAAMPVLRELRARHGVLAVTGNHDGFAGADGVVRCAQAGGIRFLRDEKVTVAGAIDVYGIDDPMATPRSADDLLGFDGVLGPEVRERPSILLWHQPIGYARLAALGVGLVLSGHTHGGQLWPFNWLTRQVHPHHAGAYRIGATRFYVSRGTGTWGPPMRIGAPPELVCLRLRTPTV